ncbi:hypothetical protein K8R47_03270 [archaeon]|nr:hypothetical protein [archaeon]
MANSDPLSQLKFGLEHELLTKESKKTKVSVSEINREIRGSDEYAMTYSISFPGIEGEITLTDSNIVDRTEVNNAVSEYLEGLKFEISKYIKSSKYSIEISGNGIQIELKEPSE